jgi:hypothetical protein
MASITILSRSAYVGMFGGESSFTFEISSTDAALIQSNHFGLTIDTNFGSNLHPSLPSSPYSEIYQGLYGPLPNDPYETLAGGWKVISGGGSWYITFAYYYQPLWTDINAWTNFSWSTVTPPVPPTTPLNIKDFKARSPYLYLAPTAAGASAGVYTLGMTGSNGFFYYTDSNTNQIISQTVLANTIQYTQCAVVGSVVGPTSGATITYDHDCSGSLIDFDSATYTIKEWTGDVNVLPSAISYSKTKQKVVNTQENLYINLANLAKEKLAGDITNYATSTGLGTINLIGVNESKWVNVVTDFVYVGATVTGKTYNDTFYVTDGYIEPKETQSIPRVLLTDAPARMRSVAKYSLFKIHFKTKNLTSIEYYTSANPTPVIVLFTGASDLNNEYVQSIQANTAEDWTQYLFHYSDTSVTFGTRIETYDRDCQYDNYDLVFKNKHGVLETLSFSKKSVRSLATTKSEFKRSIVDYEGHFDINRHTTKQYNLTGFEEWTLNTDYLPEYMNTAIQEAMLSEEIWLMDDSLSVIPVNKSDENITYKTHLNDKLIQYTLKVKLSHETINNIL